MRLADIRRQAVVLQFLAQADDGIERRTNLVRHRDEKETLRPLGRLDLGKTARGNPRLLRLKFLNLHLRNPVPVGVDDDLADDLDEHIGIVRHRPAAIGEERDLAKRPPLVRPSCRLFPLDSP